MPWLLLFMSLIMANGFKIASFNVNGISDAVKRRELFHYLHKHDFDIILLQETHSKKI